MPATVIDTEQEQEQSQSTDPADKKTGKRGRTRIPPKTLPADFDFGDTTASVPTSTSPASEPPKTLPANFDFDSGSSASATSAVRVPGHGKFKNFQMPTEIDPNIAEFNRKDALIKDWLAIKRNAFATGSKTPIPDLPPELQEFARKAGYPQFQPGSPEYGHFATPEGERENKGIIERNLARITRAGTEQGAAAGEAFANPATKPEMEILEKQSPKGAQALKDVGAVGKSFGSTVGGLVSDPTNLALMGGIGFLPKLGQRLSALGFATIAGHNVYQQSGQLGAIWDRKDIPEEQKVELMTDMIINTAMAAASGRHGLKPGEIGLPKKDSIEEQMLGEIDKLGKDAADKISGRIKQKLTLKEKLQAGMQHAAGTGPRLAEKVTKKAVADVQSKNAAEEAKSAKAQERYAAAQADHETKLARINEDFDDKISKVRQQYADDVATREKKVSELQAQHADKVAEARREWVQRAYEAKESTRAQAKVEGRREALKSAQKRYAELIRENVKAAHSSIRASLDARWNHLREIVGTEHPVSPTGIYEAVEKSRAMLAGVPADLKIFNDVFKEITEPDTFIESPEGPKPAPKEYITFDNARTHYSALGEKAYAADGNLRRALFNVYEAYDQALSKTATEAGAGKQYASVKKDWSQYMRDWHDMSSAATGGSPLARVYRAVDNPVVTAHVMSKFGDRLFATFARYDKYGANPSLLSKLRNNVQETLTLPKVKTVKEPGKFESPGEPKLPEPVEGPSGKISDLESQRAKTLERTEPPVPVKPPALTPNPTVADMVETLRRAKEEKAKDFAAGQKWHPYDLIMGSWVAFGLPDAMMSEGLSRATVHAAMYFGVRFGWMKFVKSPMGMEWMTKVTKADIDTISKTLAQSPEERTDLGKAVTETLEDTARAGGPPPNIAKFKTILTPEQQREIMKTVKDINELKARGIKPPDVTARASTEGRTVGAPNAPESSAAAGGSGTAAGAAADNADITQARKNLGLSPGQWDSRLLSEAQKIKDQRVSTSTPSYTRSLPTDFKTRLEPKVNGSDIEITDANGKVFGSVSIRTTSVLSGHSASEIGDIRVNEDRQGSGYGQALYRKAAEYAKSNGDDFLLSSGKPTPAAMDTWMRLRRLYPGEIEFKNGRWQWDLSKMK